MKVGSIRFLLYQITQHLLCGEVHVLLAVRDFILNKFFKVYNLKVHVSMKMLDVRR